MKTINVRIEQDNVDDIGGIYYYVHINKLNDYFKINKNGEVIITLSTLFRELLNINTHDDYLNLLKEYDIKHPVNSYPIKDTYVYIVLSDGVIKKIQWNDGDYVRSVYDLGKIFYTREEAEQYNKRETAIRKVTDRIKELNDGWYPDWNNIEQHKWIFNPYSHVDNSIFVDYYFYIQSYPNSYYMKSEEIAEQIRNEMFEDIKLMLGVGVTDYQN